MRIREMQIAGMGSMHMAISRYNICCTYTIMRVSRGKHNIGCEDDEQDV